MPDPLYKELFRNFGFPVSFPLNPLPPFSAKILEQEHKKEACKGPANLYYYAIKCSSETQSFIYEKKNQLKHPTDTKLYTNFVTYRYRGIPMKSMSL